ncbi:MAG: HAD hydrolase-like protein, partial [Sumerlaeia bacterium]
IRIYGYGYNCFERSLIATLRRLTHQNKQTHRFAPLAAGALRWTAFLRQHPIIFLPEVGNVLPYLAQHFPTYIVTKGDQNDQMAKVHRSGLLPFIHGAEVVPHKYQDNYKGLLDKLGIQPHEAVMIGNSPASDINNPKRLGMQTIFIPHKKTWTMEQEPILTGSPETIHIHHFGALAELFKLPL